MGGVVLFSRNGGGKGLSGGIALFAVCSQIQSAPARAAMIAYMTSRIFSATVN